MLNFPPPNDVRLSDESKLLAELWSSWRMRRNYFKLENLREFYSEDVKFIIRALRTRRAKEATTS